MKNTMRQLLAVVMVALLAAACMSASDGAQSAPDNDTPQATDFDDRQATDADEPPPLILGDCRDGMVLQPGEGCRYSGGDSSQIKVVLSVQLDGAICREGGPTKQELGSITLDVDNLRLCSSGGFERDDAFQSGIAARANSDRSWTFFETNQSAQRQGVVTAGDDMEEMSSSPGEGTKITMARADWSSGYFQSQLYKQLLEELGYGVTEPSELELLPYSAYLGMSQGDFDFWVNSWYPGHVSGWAAELPDGSTVGDHLSIVGNEMIAGGAQGFLITKSFADEHGVTHLDQLNDDPAILAAFDANDPSPGNGVADIYGCQESLHCDNIIDSQIAFSDWTNIAQVKAGYDAMFFEATAKANAGEPMVIYTWTPSIYIAQLRPGDNVVWLAVEDVLDDSNPTGLEGGAGHDQRPGIANVGSEFCPAAADADTCQLGWVANNIQVTANTEWLNANPYAAELLCQVTLSVIDVSLANVDQTNAGSGATEDFIAGQAADWISDNRALVDGWLEAARMSSMEPTCPDTVIPLVLQ